MVPVVHELGLLGSTEHTSHDEGKHGRTHACGHGSKLAHVHVCAISKRTREGQLLFTPRKVKLHVIGTDARQRLASPGKATRRAKIKADVLEPLLLQKHADKGHKAARGINGDRQRLGHQLGENIHHVLLWHLAQGHDDAKPQHVQSVEFFQAPQQRLRQHPASSQLQALDLARLLGQHQGSLQVLCHPMRTASRF